jgi:hypothetical protein
MRDCKGLRYLAELIHHPGQRFHVTELAPSAGLPDDTLSLLAENDPADAATQHERLRQSVTKRIREAIRKIREHDRALGMHLQIAVRTGMFCVYTPPFDLDATND